MSCDSLESPGLLSPGSTVRILTKELQHSLDLASATSGDKVVTAQVNQTVNLSTLFCCVLPSLHTHPAGFNIFALQENEDEQAPSQSGEQAAGPQRPRSNSGRELTDEVRASRVVAWQTVRF